LLLAEIAHVAGLIAAGIYPNPVALADVTTTTTHKTLRGPRGGMILAPRHSALTERLDAAVFPGTQGGPLMHVIAAKAVAFKEALEPSFAAYQRQVLANARLMAARLIARGYKIMTGGTDNHMLLVDLRGAAIGAAQAERARHAAHSAVNRASLPGETGSEPTQGDGGLRLGTPAVTTRGLAEPEIHALTGWIADILDARGAEDVVARVRGELLKMCAAFPVYGAQ
jgi:glycine hydroxymethyltransferase